MTNEIPDPGTFLSEEDLSDPYQVIAHFFDYCSISAHRHYISTWMEAVNQNDYWRESSPADLICYYEKLVTLVKAIHLICREEKQKKTALDLLEAKGYNVSANLMHPALYVSWPRDHTLWHYFPRSLNHEEYIDPYLVFRNFFTFYNLEEWCYELHELLSDGLSRDDPGYLYGMESNMLLIQKNLLKLVEAAHLVDVREVDHIGSRKKKQPYTLDKPVTGTATAQLFSMLPPDKTGRILPPDDEPDDEKKREADQHNDANGEGKDANSHEEDSGGKTSDNTGNREEPTALQQKPASIAVTIGGNCLVNGEPVALEPMKINFPIKISTGNN